MTTSMSPLKGMTSMMMVLLAILLISAPLFTSADSNFSQHSTPQGLTRPTDPNEFWVEMDLPPYFVPGMYNNVTISVWNFKATGPTGGLLAFQLLSSSATFIFPVIQPSQINNFCFDQNGRLAILIRSQATFLDMEIRFYPAGKIIPYLQFTCQLFMYETLEGDNNADDYLSIKRYELDSNNVPKRIETDDYRFIHPPTVLPQYLISPLPNAVTHIPGGFETRFLVYTNSAGSLSISSLRQENVQGGYVSGFGIRQSSQFQYKNSKNYKTALSDDYYGRINGLPWVNDERSEEWIKSNAGIKGDTHQIEPYNKTSSSSTFCYLLSDQDLITNADPLFPIIDLDDWSTLPQFYQRSAVLNAPDYIEFSLADAWFQLPGTHICSLNAPSGFIGPLQVALASSHLSNLPSQITTKLTPYQAPIPKTASTIPYPFWYISDSTTHSLSLTYRLPTFQRGDLIILSKNSHNSTQFSPLPWFVDTTIQPPTPSSCIPFSLNGTHIAWINQPQLYQTGIGPGKYAFSVDCTISLHILPSFYQQTIDLVFSVMPRASVPYFNPTAYENVRGYEDLYTAIDMKTTLNKIKNYDGKDDVEMVRIISANFGTSHFYSYPSEQTLGEMEIRDVYDVAFDVFKPATSPAAMQMGPNGQFSEFSSQSQQDNLYLLAESHNLHLNLQPEQHKEDQPDNYSIVRVGSITDTPQPNENSLKSEPQFTSTQTTSSDTNPAYEIADNFSTGYRLITLTISPIDMAISGGSLFDDKTNSNPDVTLPGVVDGTNVPYDPETSDPTPRRVAPTQPLTLVLDLDLGWVEKTADYDISVMCYHYLGGQPIELKMAWGEPNIYNDFESFYQRLYVQLPSTPAQASVSVRCQLPLPHATLRYSKSRLVYWLQSGTVLELHALDIYNTYARTTYTSVMHRTKAINDSKSTAKPFELYSFPMQSIKNGLVGDIKFPHSTFTRPTTNLSPQSPDTSPLPVELITISNVSFVIDYGVNNNDALQAYIDIVRQSGLGDFILPAAHLTRFPKTNRHTLAGLDNPQLTLVPTNDNPVQGAMTDALAPTSVWDRFTFLLRGEIKSATVNMYDHLITTIQRVLGANKYLRDQINMTDDEFNQGIRLVTVLPYYGDEIYKNDADNNPPRFINTAFDLSQIRPAVTLNGMDSVYGDTYIATRNAVTFAWVGTKSLSSPSGSIFSTSQAPFFNSEFSIEWNRLFEAGETQFQIDGQEPIVSAIGAIFYDQCLLKVTDDFYNSAQGINKYIKMNSNNDYDEETRPVNERSISCGGKCDLLCPDSFKCRRHTDCYHGNCNNQGICGPSQHLNFDVLRTNAATPGLDRTSFTFAICLILMSAIAF